MSTFHVPSSPKPASPDSSRLSQLPYSAPTPSKKKQIRRRCIRRPAENSIYDLIHENAGTSLFVRPICWTDLHSQLLGVRFVELARCDAPLPAHITGSPPSRGHMRPSESIKSLSRDLSNIMASPPKHPMVVSRSMRSILSTLWRDTFSQAALLPELHIFFGGRLYRDAVRAQIMWAYPTDDDASGCTSFRTVSTRPASSFGTSSEPLSQELRPAGLPMLCYVGKAQLASIRKNIFRVVSGPNSSWNAPVHRLQQLRAKGLIPSNADEDAHFVGLFLAMAQQHFYTTARPAAPKNSQYSSRRSNNREGKGVPLRDFHDLELRILSHDSDTAELIVYKGYVSTRFLQWFHEPCKTPEDEKGQAGVPGIKVEYAKVPVWPILGLRERLGKALGKELVGAFDPEDIETWEDVEDQVTKAPTSDGEKRKREVLAEVCNKSFEETSGDEDEPVMRGKKQCIGEGSPVGMVV